MLNQNRSFWIKRWERSNDLRRNPRDTGNKTVRDHSKNEDERRGEDPHLPAETSVVPDEPPVTDPWSVLDPT